MGVAVVAGWLIGGPFLVLASALIVGVVVAAPIAGLRSIGWWWANHLESRGTPGPRRRDLRRELRANRLEAAQSVGVTATLDGIGSPRALAVQVGELDRSRPRWWPGLLWGVATFAVTLLGLVWVCAVMLATLTAAGGGSAVIEIPPWWGVRFFASVGADGVAQSVGAEGVLLWMMLPLVVFLLAAQPWRPWTHRYPVRTQAVRGSVSRNPPIGWVLWAGRGADHGTGCGGQVAGSGR